MAVKFGSAVVMFCLQDIYAMSYTLWISTMIKKKIGFTFNFCTKHQMHFQSFANLHPFIKCLSVDAGYYKNMITYSFVLYNGHCVSWENMT